MYECEYKEREKNPKANANFLSLITFFYIRDLFYKNRGLNKGDLYDVLKMYESNKLGDELEKEWNVERLKERPSLIRILAKNFGWRTLVIGTHLIFYRTIFMICQPFLIEKLIVYFKRDQKDVTFKQAHLYGIVFILLLIFRNTYFQNCEYQMSELAIKAKTALSSLIYRKTLKLNQASVEKMSSGRIVSLISKDINTIEETIICTNMLWTGGLQLIVLTYIMYRAVGVSAFIGVAYMFVSIPLEMCLGTCIRKLRKGCGTKTDERLRLIQEILTTMKVIKMFTWERFYANKVENERTEEMKKLRWIVYLKAFIMCIAKLSIRISFYLCIITYIYYENDLKIEQVFVVLTCYETVRGVLSVEVPLAVGNLSETSAALYRIIRLLQEPEMTLKQQVNDETKDAKEPFIKLNGVVISANKKYILEVHNLKIERGLTALVGSIGAGKSTLLKAILHDIKIDSGNIEINGQVSFASQEPWIFTGTIRQNILFGQPYDIERYNKIIQICTLRKDIDRFPDGDQTILIDNGLNLSRGQQVRINLARAVYKDVDIYLLDDSLSSLDTNVGRYIFNNCIKDFLKDKLCIFATQQCFYIKEVNNVISIKGGRVAKEEVKFSGHIKNVSIDSLETQEVVNNDVDDDEMKENDDETSKLFSKEDVYDEENKTGKIDFNSYKRYLTSGNALHYVILAAVSSFLGSSCGTYFDYYVTKWTDTEEMIHNLTRHNLTNTLEYENALNDKSDVPLIYTLIVISNVLFDLIETISFCQFAMCASITLHNKIFKNIMKATMDFFDMHMTGNVLNRFAKDMGIIDEQLPSWFFNAVSALLSITGIFTLIVAAHYIFILYSGIYTIVLYIMATYYLPIGRSLKRLEASTRAPVVGHINASLKGLTTIRANQAENILIKQFDKHQDLHSSTCLMNLASSSGFSYYGELWSIIYTGVIIFTFLNSTDITASKVGLAITQSFALSGTIRYMIFATINLENHMTSVERVTNYLDIEQETDDGLIVKDWPRDGQIEFGNVYMKYCTNPTYVLKKVNFVVKPCEKVAIIGRTGAGKSSIISALFRLYDFTGSVIIGNRDIKTLKLNYLRSNLAIIPQDSVLITGTLRTNLDPDDEHTDDSLWRALSVINAKDYFDNLNETIREGGTNYSIGQKQLICLARALLTKRKIVILDEATANIDPQMDALIQTAISEEFNDCTVLTVIHNLDGVMNYDKVLVIDGGRLIEFDEPSNLIKNPNGYFWNMAKRSGVIR